LQYDLYLWLTACKNPKKLILLAMLAVFKDDNAWSLGGFVK
jgi:hypothetical protein